MTKNRTPTPVYLDPGMHPGLEVKGLNRFSAGTDFIQNLTYKVDHRTERAKIYIMTVDP